MGMVVLVLFHVALIQNHHLFKHCCGQLSLAGRYQIRENKRVRCLLKVTTRIFSLFLPLVCILKQGKEWMSQPWEWICADGNVLPSLFHISAVSQPEDKFTFDASPLSIPFHISLRLTWLRFRNNIYVLFLLNFGLLQIIEALIPLFWINFIVLNSGSVILALYPMVSLLIYVPIIL